MTTEQYEEVHEPQIREDARRERGEGRRRENG